MSDSEAKRTEYQRSQMSLGERVEVLERAVDRLRANKATLDWAEYVDRRLAGHSNRLGELSKSVREIVERELEAMKDTDAKVEPLSPAPVVPVYPEELARLRRIEEAARGVEGMIDHSEPYYLRDWSNAVGELRAALDSEPER